MTPYLVTGELTNLLASVLNISVTLATLSFIAVAVWSVAWKGVALWVAARNHQKRWFIALLVVNTIGILEIVYLLWFRSDKKEGVTQSLFNTPLPDSTKE